MAKRKRRRLPPYNRRCSRCDGRFFFIYSEYVYFMRGPKSRRTEPPSRTLIDTIDDDYFTEAHALRRYPREVVLRGERVRFRSLEHYVSSHDSYCRAVVFGSPDDRWLPMLHSRNAPSGFQIVEGT